MKHGLNAWIERPARISSERTGVKRFCFKNSFWSSAISVHDFLGPELDPGSGFFCKRTFRM